MKRIQTKKPGSVAKRYPGQQHHFGKQVARANYTKFNPVAKHYGRSVLPSPADFYASEIEGFSEGNNGWASGCCPFHDDHNPSFAMNLGVRRLQVSVVELRRIWRFLGRFCLCAPWTFRPRCLPLLGGTRMKTTLETALALREMGFASPLVGARGEEPVGEGWADAPIKSISELKEKLPHRLQRRLPPRQMVRCRGQGGCSP